MPEQRQCIDCIREGITTTRRVTAGGPRSGRCATHHRAEKARRRLARHARDLSVEFGISGEDYWAIHAAQGGRCYGCGVATGKTKRLAVDHDHRCAAGHPPNRGCRRCVRALLCGPCNQTIGRLGIEALCRLIEVLADPPAQKVLHRA